MSDVSWMFAEFDSDDELPSWAPVYRLGTLISGGMRVSLFVCVSACGSQMYFSKPISSFFLSHKSSSQVY